MSLVGEPAIAPRSRADDMDRDWSVVAASVLGLSLSVGTLLVYSFGVFVRPLSAEFGWSRTELSGAVALSQYTMALSGWFWGALIDRFGPRAVVVPSVIIIGMLVASLGLLTPSLLLYYLVFAAIPVLAGGATPLGYCGVLVRRFDRYRGLALGIALMGIGLGAAILPPLVTMLIEREGWRQAYVLLGALTVIVTLPSALVATRGLHYMPDRRRYNVPVIGVLALVFTRSFMLICAAFLVLGIVSIGAVAHLVPMMVDRGFSPAAAARVAGLTGLATLVFRAGAGWVLDRVHARYVLAAIAALAAAALLLLAYGSGAGAAYLAALLLGAVLGAEADLIAYQVSRYFEAVVFGKLFGIAFGVYVVGVGTGPLLMGASFDYLGGYRPGLLAFVGLSVVVAMLAFAMPDYETAEPRGAR